MRIGWLLCCVLIAGVGGCANHRPMTADVPSTPRIGALCAVQFLPSAQGSQNRDQPVPLLTNSINGASVSVTGTLKRFDDQWIVLQTHQQNVWIPRQHVLLITEDVRGK